jgi:hypothetical protein
LIRKRYELIGTLEGETLKKWLVLWARDDAMRANASWYSKEEGERHFLEWTRFQREVAERNEIDDMRTWTITRIGNIVYDNEPGD